MKLMCFTVLNASIKRKSDEIQQPNKNSGDKYGYLREIHTKHKIKRLKLHSEEPAGNRNFGHRSYNSSN